MSRTYKDKPWKHREPELADYHFDYYKVEKCEVLSSYTNLWYKRYGWIQYPGMRAKKKRSYREPHWMKTPMWWIHEMMTVPQRRKGRAWEHKVVAMSICDVDLADTPPNSRKPHWYYW